LELEKIYPLIVSEVRLSTYAGPAMHGSNIKTLRKRLRLSQEAMAEYVGISRNRLGHMERGVDHKGPVVVDKKTALAILYVYENHFLSHIRRIA